ncbi:hypothetical protein ACOME3_003385 [Neoechinorhynchus agilis]
MLMSKVLSDEAWRQASLPVSSGGLGIWALVDLALSAFLGLFERSLPVSKKILKEKFCLDRDFVVEVEELCQQTGANHAPP